MSFRNFSLTLLFALALGLGACTSAPIYNVASDSFSAGEAKPLAVRSEQIKRAGAQLGWIVEDVTPPTPGVLKATLYIRSHKAVVRIDFSQTQFSITYVDSSNLNYDGQTIHRNYNGWIQNLRGAIIEQSI